MITFSSLCNTSPQDLSRQSILPHEPRTFDCGIAAHTVISNQNGSITDASVVLDPNVSTSGVLISPEPTQQQKQKQRGEDPDGSSYLELD